MSTTSWQGFRAQSSSKIISVPIRHDSKSNQRVIRWKDIQLCFKDAQYVKYDGNVVPFLTDEDLEDLIPLRIAYHPGTVLEVVITDEDQGMGDDHQGDSSPVVQRNDKDMSSLRIGDVDNNQALVVRSQGHTAAIAVQRLPNTSAGHYQQGSGNSVTLQEQLHQLQHQIEGVLGKMQQTDQQTQHAQRQVQDQIDKILQTLQQMDRQHTEETQRMTLQLDLHRQQLEEVQHNSQQQLEQQIEVVHQKTQQLDQQMHDIRQQAQQQIDKVQNNVQQLERHSEEQHKQLLQQMRGLAKARQEHDQSSPEPGHQEIQYALNQFVHAQCRIQAVLAEPSSELPTPRLFIIIPTPTTVVDEQESCQLQFRLYFLCECGSHTMATDCNEPHKVHLANHPGYDLTNQDEFVNKYGSYLLAMMYMVKYGAKTRGLVVPPSLGLNNAIGEGENISQLVEETISHLKEVTGSRDATVHQGLDASELNALKSYLKFKDGESRSGGLSQLKTQKAQYPWVCRDHLREYYESTLQELRRNINASDGIWRGTEVKVQVTSEATIKMFYDGLSKLFRIQSVENWRSITEVDLNLENHPSMSGSTMDILSNHDGLETLSLDFGRLTMSAKNISRGELKDVTISVGDISALTLNDMEFIQQCRPAAFVITGTPQEKNDSRLVRILQSYPSITSLRIECDMKRLMAVIDLVKSTGEKMLQGEDKPALRVFELVHSEIKVKVSFEVGSPSFEVETYIRLAYYKPENVDPTVCTFIRQYGWSVATFVVPGSFNDALAKLLDESIQERGSRIVHLDMAPTSLTTPGLDAMNRVIDRSQGLTYLRLSLDLHTDSDYQRALILLKRHKERLTSLQLTGSYIRSCLSQFSDTQPRNVFPALEEFSAVCSDEYLYGGRQIKSMVSAPGQQQTSLKVLRVNVRFGYTNLWEEVIKAIDISALEELHFNYGGFCGFTQVQLTILVDYIVGSGAPSLPLRLLNLNGITLDKSASTYELFARLREKVPEIKIIGVDA